MGAGRGGSPAGAAARPDQEQARAGHRCCPRRQDGPALRHGGRRHRDRALAEAGRVPGRQSRPPAAARGDRRGRCARVAGRRCRSPPSCSMRPAPPPARSAATPTSPGRSRRTTWRAWPRPRRSCSTPRRASPPRAAPSSTPCARCSPRRASQRIEAFLAGGAPFERSPIARHELKGLEVDLTAAGEVRTLPSHLAAQGGIDGFFIARLKRTGS